MAKERVIYVTMEDAFVYDKLLKRFRRVRKNVTVSVDKTNGIVVYKYMAIDRDFDMISGIWKILKSRKEA